MVCRTYELLLGCYAHYNARGKVKCPDSNYEDLPSRPFLHIQHNGFHNCWGYILRRKQNG
jgi:hypothetical protein